MKDLTKDNFDEEPPPSSQDRNCLIDRDNQLARTEWGSILELRALLGGMPRCGWLSYIDDV